MNTIVNECDGLLKWLELQRQTIQKRPIDEMKIYAIMITEYQNVMLRLEQVFIKRDMRKYLEIRRARHAVWQGMERIVPADVLYLWMVENICDLEIG